MSLAQKVFFLFPYYSIHKNHHQNPQFSIAHIEKFLPARIDHPLNLICDRLCFFDRLYNSPAASKKHSDIVILPSHWVLKYYSIELKNNLCNLFVDCPRPAVASHPILLLSETLMLHYRIFAYCSDFFSEALG